MEYIRLHEHLYGIEPICQVLGAHDYQIAPATYHAYKNRDFGPTPADLRDAYNANALFDLWADNWEAYGVRKLYHAARQAGLDLGRDQVARLMGIARIQGIVRGKTPKTTTPDANMQRFPDLVERGWNQADRPDQIWVADFTYQRTNSGFCYVSFVTDVYSRRILGWAVSPSMDASLVTKALDHALSTRSGTGWSFSSKGIIHHSDAGSQYTSLLMGQSLADAGIQGSIGTVGDAYDNSLMESTIGLYKTELRPDKGKNWASWQQLELATARWVNWYNNTRLHSAIGYTTPENKENEYHQQAAATTTQAA